MNKFTKLGNLIEKLGISEYDVDDILEDEEASINSICNALENAANHFNKDQLPSNWKVGTPELEFDYAGDIRVAYRFSNDKTTIKIFYVEDGYVELWDEELGVSSQSGEYDEFDGINRKNANELLKAYELVIENWDNYWD